MASAFWVARVGQFQFPLFFTAAVRPPPPPPPPPPLHGRRRSRPTGRAQLMQLSAGVFFCRAASATPARELLAARGK
jgi:hypothetical protein